MFADFDFHFTGMSGQFLPREPRAHCLRPASSRASPLGQGFFTGITAAQLSSESFLTLLQDESTAEITFYMKGADVAMSTIVQYNDWLEEEVSKLFSALYKTSSGYLVNQRQKSHAFSTLVPLERIVSSPF